MTDQEVTQLNELVKQYIQKDNAYFHRFVAFWFLLALIGLVIAPSIGNYLATN